MQRLDGVIRGAYELGGLSAGEEAGRLYGSLGWERWRGRTWVLGPNGMERTADEDETHLRPAARFGDPPRRGIWPATGTAATVW